MSMAHTRLAIIDTEGGNQPLLSNDGTLSLCVNGEIFNYKELRAEFSTYQYNTKSDCESILGLYDYYRHNAYKKTETPSTPSILTHQQIISLLGKLDGQFSFVLHDTNTNMVLIARDPFGITQLYYGMDSEGTIHVASEIKALTKCVSVNVFPSGSYLYINVNDSMTKYVLNPIKYFSETEDGSWLNNTAKVSIQESSSLKQYYYEPQPLLNEEEQIILMGQVKEAFENAVIKRLMSDVPFGILLSGGLDSSLVASVAVKYIRAHPEIYGVNPKIHTFSVGMSDSSDLRAAKIVADFLQTTHHELIFTAEEALNTLEEIISVLETYDITTIRASLPMYLLTRKIRAMGIKMVLSGEGSDELNGSYLYFHQAPNDEEHQLECKKRILDLGYFDCLRADKSSMGSSVEIRVPFLDTKFVKLCINIHKDIKTQKGIEKYLLRKAFDIKEPNMQMQTPMYLPDSILWRQKVQFSDGVGTNHIDSLKAFTDKEVNEKHLSAYMHKDFLYPYNTPHTTEAFYYRIIFEDLFPNRSNTAKYWIPNTKWEGVSSDPSGRCQLSFKENELYES
jgi:asparagine synthase (glutamine-hydrolysing)